MVSTLENLQRFWYVAGLSEALRRKPLARMVVGQPIVLFRDAAGQAHALLDRCCHRSLPLSLGTVTLQGLQCNYHGWEFSSEGQCIRIPGLPSQTGPVPRACVPTFPVMEQDGLIWIYAIPDVQPPIKPFRIPFAEDSAYGTVRIDLGPMEAPVENVIDNFADSLHPPFVHKGLIYDDKKRNRLEIEVRSYRDPEGHRGVEGCYLGEPPPTQGLIGRIFAERSADAVVHEERYIVPTLHQAEYRIGNTSHLLSTHVFVPETLTRTRMYLVLRTKSRLPKGVTNLIMRALFTRLFRQDIQVLERQQRSIALTGSLPRVSSELDLLGLSTVHFLNQVAEGKPPAEILVKPQRYRADI